MATGQKGTNGYTRVYCTNAACAENGYDGYYIPNESIIPFAHVYGDWTVTKSATCSEPGEKVRTCSLCGGEDKVVIPANRIDDGTPEGKPKHSLVVMEYGYAATCTTPGRTNYTYCSQCGDFFAAQDIPATGHQLSPGTSNENFCVLCNSYVLEEGENGVVCGCMCHNEDGLAKFFFKIIMFFCNIFGINQTCECGANHMETNSTTKK